MTKDKFDEFVDNLQKEIIQQEREDFNEKIVELFHNPPNWGKPKEEEITIASKYLGNCGDLMQFFLKINDNGIIEDVHFITDGCGASVAAGAQTTLLIEGKSIEEAKKVLPNEIDKALGGLPKGHKHCASLAIRSLRSAILEFEKINSNE